MSVLSNNERLRQIADALDDLNANVMYVGGAVIQLYSSDATAIKQSLQRLQPEIIYVKKLIAPYWKTGVLMSSMTE